MGAPTDRVRILKNERPTTGGTQDDLGFPAQLNPNEDAPSVRGVFLQGSTGEDNLAYLTRDASGNMIFRDVVTGTEYTLAQLTTGGGGISEAQHEVLDSLVHALAEDFYLEVTRAAGKVSTVIVYTDATKTTKIRELSNIVRTGGRIDSYDVIQYDGLGSVKQTMSYAITRTAGRVSSITATES
jgi:hypothetical protein